MQLFAILEQLFSRADTSGKEKGVLDWIACFLKRFSFEVRWQEYSPGRWNLHAWRGKNPPPFLIVTHVDVWGKEPKGRCRVEGGFVRGRGAADPLGQVVALLLALSRSSTPAEVVFFSEEETTGAGSWNFQFAREIRGALVLEPTNFAVCTALAGDLDFKVEIEGLAAHGAFPQSGVNAISRAREVIDGCYRAVASFPSHPLFSPPLSLMLGKIEGGSSSYVVPDRCLLECCLPFPPPLTVSQAEATLLRFIPQAGVKVEVLDQNPAFELSAKEEIVEKLVLSIRQRVGFSPVLAGMPSWTDATYLNLRGIPSIVFGAGDLSLAHSEREMVSLKELAVLTDILGQFLTE